MILSNLQMKNLAKRLHINGDSRQKWTARSWPSFTAHITFILFSSSGI